MEKIPWRREWLPTPVLLPGEFHGQRRLAGYSPWGLKGLDLTEQLTLTSLRSHTVTQARLCIEAVTQILTESGRRDTIPTLHREWP